MTGTRQRAHYVLLGLGRPRASWFRDVAQWATSGALPAEVVKCVSAEEVRARLRGGRPFSALLVDGALRHTDRDLLAAARDAGVPTLVVDDTASSRDWLGLGAAAVLPSALTREVLLDALASHAALLDGGEPLTVDGEHEVVLTGAAGRLVAVTGPGGTGASTAAAALAQGLAARDAAASDALGRAGHGEPPRGVLLADLCRHAEQGMLHDTADVVPGLQELVDAHRGRTPTADEVHALTFDVPARGYRLLLGLRRARYWAALRPRALAAGVATLRRAFGAVVCDVDADLEGEDAGGSVDVEERNALARTATRDADVVVVVGAPGAKGTFSLVRVVGDLLELGVPGERLLPAVARAPRSPRARAELARGVGELLATRGAGSVPAPVFLPHRRVEAALRDGAPLPEPLPTALTRAVVAADDRRRARRGEPAGLPATDPPALAARRVRPGELGALADDDTDDPAA